MVTSGRFIRRAPVHVGIARRPDVCRTCNADLLQILHHRLVYSWQWGNLNYDATLLMLQQLHAAQVMRASKL